MAFNVCFPIINRENSELLALSHHVSLVIDNADGPLKKRERKDGKL